MSTQADIGLIGLAVMGQNLALNIHDNGYKIAVFNRTTQKVDDFLNGPAKGTGVIGCHSLHELISNLKRPRKVMFMIKAGHPVDALIEECLPHLEPGDIIIDGGNSHYIDSQKRYEMLKEKGLLYLATGISGGEEGARHGPSIMPGGHIDAWHEVKPIFQAIAAKSEDNEPCCDWVGEGGAGHYVKMVHNGIEYGDMQIICEAYDLLTKLVHMDVDQLSSTFEQWNQGELDSYLIEITAAIFKHKDRDGVPLIDKILDTAGQKGTGKWTGMSALELGIPVTLIGEAVFARCLSALHEMRQKCGERFQKLDTPSGQDSSLVDPIKDALYASKMISYTQGFMLLRQAATEYKWDLNYGGIALMWRGGCIIRSQFLGKIKEAFERNKELSNLLLDDFFEQEITKTIPGFRKVVMAAVEHGVPAPCFSTALAFFDGMRSKRLPANLLQAQRDFFGAHTYERIDEPRGKFFHTNWTGQGGDVSSSSYSV